MEKLNTFPTDPSELSAWWVEELGKKPPKPKKNKVERADEEDEEIPDVENEDEEDDWKKFFDDERVDLPPIASLVASSPRSIHAHMARLSTPPFDQRQSNLDDASPEHYAWRRASPPDQTDPCNGLDKCMC